MNNPQSNNARTRKRSISGGRFVFDVFENGSKVATGLPQSSVNGNPRGGTFDSSANSYTGPPDNSQTGNRNIVDDNVDAVPRVRISEETGGGGAPSGFQEEIFDVVQDDNTAGQRIFLTKFL